MIIVGLCLHVLTCNHPNMTGNSPKIVGVNNKTFKTTRHSKQRDIQNNETFKTTRHSKQQHTFKPFEY